MPVRWRTNFINSGQSLSTASIKSIRTYIVQQEQQIDAHRKKVRDTNKKNGKNQKGTKTTRLVSLHHTNHVTNVPLDQDLKAIKRTRRKNDSRMRMIAQSMEVLTHGGSVIKTKPNAILDKFKSIIMI